MTRPFKSFAVIPAAGKSRRMGRPKLLLPWKDSTVLEATLAAWRAAEVTRIVLVCRQDDEALAALARKCGAEVLTPPVDPPEMKDSIQVALAHLSMTDSPQDDDVWLLAPADMPWLSANVVRQLISSHDPDSSRILVPVNQGKRGHPVLFPWPTAAAVQALNVDQGVNHLLEAFGWTPIAVDEQQIHGDLDTPQDYESRRSE